MSRLSVRFGRIKWHTLEWAGVTSPVSRAGAVAAIGLLAVLTPLVGWMSVVLFGLIAVGAAQIPASWRLFGLLADPTERKHGRLDRITVFVLAIVVLSAVASQPWVPLPTVIVPIAVLLVAGGNLVAALVASRQFDEAIAFGVGGAVAAAFGYGIVRIVSGTSLTVTTGGFLIVTGALIATLGRTDLVRRADPIVLVVVGAVLWLLASLPIEPTFAAVAIALAVTVPFGAVAYLTGTASTAGMVSGILLGFVTIVLAGLGWFALLFAFFALGGLATKYRYDEKALRGVAEDDDGARGTSNVFGNSLVAMVAVVGYAASPAVGIVDPIWLAVAFSGAVATALADTFSSEFGSLYDRPRLITTLEPVSPGTNGGVTPQGALAGVVGAAVIAGMGVALIDGMTPVLGGIVFVGGVFGMFADSVFGATVEDELVGNGGVNLLATLVGALLALVLSMGVAA